MLQNSSYLRHQHEKICEKALDNDEVPMSLIDFLETISKGFQLKHFDKGELLFNIGDIGQEMFILVNKY